MIRGKTLIITSNSLVAFRLTGVVISREMAVRIFNLNMSYHVVPVSRTPLISFTLKSKILFYIKSLLQNTIDMNQRNAENRWFGCYHTPKPSE